MRLLLQDQTKWGWFIPYAGCRSNTGEYTCKNNVTGKVDATANLYHDEEQTWVRGFVCGFVSESATRASLPHLVAHTSQQCRSVYTRCSYCIFADLDRLVAIWYFGNAVPSTKPRTQEQTPGWTGGGNGGPDGICHGDTKGNHINGSTQSGSCDCGEGVSCGEYLWDHRNGSSLTTWLTETYIGGKEYGLGNPNVDGLCVCPRPLRTKCILGSSPSGITVSKPGSLTVKGRLLLHVTLAWESEALPGFENGMPLRVDPRMHPESLSHTFCVRSFLDPSLCAQLLRRPLGRSAV